MKKCSCCIQALMILLLCSVGFAAPFDDPGKQLSQQKLKVQVAPMTAQQGVGFTFANFTHTIEPQSGAATWRVDLSIDKSIPGHTYVIKSRFTNRTGEELFSGEDIPLPVANAGKVFMLTRNYQDRPEITGMTLTVHHQGQQQTLMTQTYPLRSAMAAFQGGPASASAKPHLPQQATASDLPRDLEIRYQVRAFQDRDTYQVCVRNDSAFAVNIDPATLVYEFSAGVNGRDLAGFSGKRVDPGKEQCDTLNRWRVECATLERVSLVMKLNGNEFVEPLFSFDAEMRPSQGKFGVISAIPAAPELKQAGLLDFLDVKIVAVSDTVDLTLILRERLVREGTSLLARGYATIDGSNRFPVVLNGGQSKDDISFHTRLQSTQMTKDKTFCFNLTEIFTDDSLTCGGVGVMLYRHVGGDFLVNKACRTVK